MSFVNKIIDQMVEASEEVIRVVEEGTSILLGKDGQNNGGKSLIHEISETTEEDWGDFSVLGDDEILNEPSPLNSIAEEVLGNIMMNQSGPQSTWDHFQAFKSAITWSEPFILYLISFHVLVALLNIFVIRNRGLVSRFLLLCFMAMVVRGAEYLNRYGSSHWEHFATQNYFDMHGVFVTLMLCVPLLIMAFIQLLVLLREAKDLLIQVKSHELRQKLKKKSN